MAIELQAMKKQSLAIEKETTVGFEETKKLTLAMRDEITMGFKEIKNNGASRF